MNLGYGVPENGTDPAVSQKWLYEKLVEGVDISGKEVLEVGCGRGGGCAHLAQKYQPAHMTGLDLSRANIRLSRKFNRDNNNEFVRGSGSDFQLNRQFDVVINLESSHAYPSVPDFLEYVKAHLKPQGVFCYSDIFHTPVFEKLEFVIAEKGFVIVEKENISEQVAASIKANAIHWTPMAEKYPRMVPMKIHDVNVSTHSHPYRGLLDGSVSYWRYVLRLDLAR